MPTIRIDDEVYSWLQSNAKAFEDTPNSVLRRIAKLGGEADTGSGGEAQTKRKQASPQRSGLTGRQLNDKWKVGARHALFHRHGHWYNNLERFPGALFDPNGFVVFESREDYMNCEGVSVKQETNVKDGIEWLPGYVQKRGTPLA